MDDDEKRLKVILLGDASVGKTSIAQRQATNSFEFRMRPTVGIAHLASVIEVDHHSVRLMLWDTAGQEQFASLIPIYIRGAHVCILVASIVDPESCAHLDLWHSRLIEAAGPTRVIAAINKMDLLDGVPMTIKEIRERYQATFKYLFFVSARTGDSITEMFRQAALLALHPELLVQPSQCAMSVEREMTERRCC
jgi:small GTP-binding protein